MKGIGDRKLAILDELNRSIAERGYSPTVREIGALVGLKSSSTVQRHLNELEERGYLTREPSGPRTLRLSDLGQWLVNKERQRC